MKYHLGLVISTQPLHLPLSLVALTQKFHGFLRLRIQTFDPIQILVHTGKLHREHFSPSELIVFVHRERVESKTGIRVPDLLIYSVSIIVG